MNAISPRRSHALVGAIAVLALLLASCDTSAGPLRQGDHVPTLTITTRTGASAEIVPAGDHALWLVFWASWCYPCRAEWPGLNKAQQEQAAMQVRLVAISVDEQASTLEQFLAAHPANFEVVRDPEGQIAKRFGVMGFPTHVLIDEAGVVRAIVRGPLDGARARALLQPGTATAPEE